jgi:hypothetical protein
MLVLFLFVEVRYHYMIVHAAKEGAFTDRAMKRIGNRRTRHRSEK